MTPGCIDTTERLVKLINDTTDPDVLKMLKDRLYFETMASIKAVSS